MNKQLIKGNLAIAEAAIRVGLDAYFGYPITPQTELLEWMSKRMPEEGRVFLQAESELAAINMVYGAACTGARVMTSSSSPGISLMMEGISYITATEVPFVLVDLMRAGPGLGNIDPAQCDYHQMVHGGAHGDYYWIVLASSSVQEAIDHTVLAFELAEKYRTMVVVLLDGSIGQMMEPAILPPMQPAKMKQTGFEPPNWAVRGKNEDGRRVLTSILMNPREQEEANIRLLKRWHHIKENEIRYKDYYIEDAEYVVIGFGTAGRVALTAVRSARSKGVPVGLFRPITLKPFPEKEIEEISKQVKSILVVEMNAGQMFHDIKQIVKDNCMVDFYGRLGGILPYPDEIQSEIRRMIVEPLRKGSDPIKSWLNRLESIRSLETYGR